MKFKLDENFASRTVEVFRAEGHDIQTVRDEKLGGAGDARLHDNVLIWKVPGMRDSRNVHDSAEWWAGELLDKDIKIKWSRKREQFHL